MSLNYLQSLVKHEGCGGYYHHGQEFMESPIRCKDYCLWDNCWDNYTDDESGTKCVGAFKRWLKCSKCGEIVDDYKELRR